MFSEEVTKNITEGSKFYASKDYDLAASKYADACAAYNDENGSDDADLLLLYGKALFQNGVAKSGVLGGMGNDEEKPLEKPLDETEDDANFQFEEGFAEEEDEDDGNNGNDENEENSESGAAQEPDDQSDFEAAWEILDLARSIFAESVESFKETALELREPYLKADDEEPSSEYVSALRKLSETYDLLGEVSLESENFPQAALDLQSCLKLRLKLYDNKLSALVSESHYKLSLALEFCVEDPELRKKAAQQMKCAIDCVNARMDTAENKQDTRELLRDLQERYKELSKDPVQEVQSQQLDIIKGLLGEAISGDCGLGASTKKVAVNDLSGMVKKRKPKPEPKTDAKKPRTE